jgi:diguanylate cyclase (GGDEF)-like protein
MLMNARLMDPSPDLIAGVAETTLYRDRDDIEQSLVQLLTQFLEAESVELFRLDSEGGAAVALPRLCAVPDGHGSVQITRGGMPNLVLAGLPLWRLSLEERFANSTPLSSGLVETLHPVVNEVDVSAGMLRIRTRRALDARELYLVGGILQIIRNHLALIDYGERDTLTGLLNRKTFEHQFAKLQAVPREAHADQGSASWIGLVDIDKFKSINDRFGHVFGDEVLLLVSQIIQRSFRSVDKSYRFGGEEFAILLQGTTEEITARVLERLRAAVDQHRFPQVGSVTISVGWTRIRQSDTPVNAIERADAALYHAKHSGRNLVFQHEALQAASKLPEAGASNAGEIELF